MTGIAGVYILKNTTTGDIHGVYATCAAAEDAREEIRTAIDDPGEYFGSEYQLESWAVL